MTPRYHLSTCYSDHGLTELAAAVKRGSDIEVELIVAWVEGQHVSLQADRQVLCSIHHSGEALHRAKRLNAAIAVGDFSEFIRRGKPISRNHITRRAKTPLLVQYGWERITRGRRKGGFLRNHPKIRLGIVVVFGLLACATILATVLYGQHLDEDVKNGLIQDGVKSLSILFKDFF